MRRRCKRIRSGKSDEAHGRHTNKVNDDELMARLEANPFKNASEFAGFVVSGISVHKH